ncbi:ROK family transcriptional regulator, partial [Streptomyces sp. SID3343]|uniref:ROK family transcriptional regulator n=1 Tax=Streptomyces sp. SID3343 TaxID=2690260 RepID=UPI001370D0F1
MKDTEALPGGDQSALRRLNTSRVLRLLYEGGPLATNAIARVTGLSRPTVRGIVAELLEAGTVRSDGLESVPTGGRPAQRYAFDLDAGRLAGVHIDAASVSVRLTDLGGRHLASGTRALPVDSAPQARIAAAAELARELLAEDPAPLWAVGAGTPGIIDAAGAVRLSVAIPRWSGVRLAENLGARLGCPVTAMKDTNLAALAEHRVGAARGTADVLYVQIGRRLGVGVLVDGRPFTGRTGAAGEIGQHPGLGWNDAPARLLAEAGEREDGGAQQTALVLTRARHGDPGAQAAV